MCDSCRVRTRFQTRMIERRHFPTPMPTWLDTRARDYILARRYHTGNTSIEFGRQVVWTWVRTRFGQEEVAPYLAGMEVFEYFPTSRTYYDSVFTVQRSSPGIIGGIIDFFTQDDEIWEALYQSYQMMNEDMYTLAYLRHQRPSAARGYLARLDDNLCRQIIGAMIKLTTTYIAPASGAHGMGTLNQVSQQIATALGMNTSMSDMIIRASEHQGGTYRASGRQ